MIQYQANSCPVNLMLSLQIGMYLNTSRPGLPKQVGPELSQFSCRRSAVELSVLCTLGCFHMANKITAVARIVTPVRLDDS